MRVSTLWGLLAAYLLTMPLWNVGWSLGGTWTRYFDAAVIVIVVFMFGAMSTFLYATLDAEEEEADAAFGDSEEAKWRGYLEGKP